MAWKVGSIKLESFQRTTTAAQFSDVKMTSHAWIVSWSHEGQEQICEHFQ
jgi:hypothetical protein